MADTDGITYDAETTAWLKSLDALIKQKRIGLTIFHYSMWTDNRAGRTVFLDWFGGSGFPMPRTIRSTAGACGRDPSRIRS